MTEKMVLSLPTEMPAAEIRLERLKLARDLFREFYAQCFWHCPEDLDLTEDHIPMVAKGLRTYGGRRGFILSGKLREVLECP